MSRFFEMFQVGWLAAASLGLVLVSDGQASAAEAVTCTNSQNQTTCRIEQPAVGQREKDYPQVRFAPGDNLVVSAGGCVQTGGSGKTWKLYVDPQGNGSDRLYHGLIWIPGVTSDLIRISSVVNRTLSISSSMPASSALYLRLGYEDDSYGDNGYWGHDDGDNDQCKNVSDAWVQVSITHNTVAADKPYPDPLDLITVQYDANLLALNPTWAGSAKYNGAAINAVAFCPGGAGKLEGAPCTSQSPSVDDLASGIHWPGLCSSDYGINGHLNWFPATYEGVISFENHDDPTFGDDDYNWELVPSQSGAGLLLGNGGSLHLEFDSDETVDHFRQAWWQNFHSQVDNNVGQAKAMVGNKRAIVSGLIGIDFVHDPATEIHPVYAMAIEVNPSSGDNTWAIFVRNFGDEGECSQQQHYLDLPGNYYTFSLPWPQGATGYSVVSQDFQTISASAVSGPYIQPSGLGTFRRLQVSFLLPAPEQQSHTDGELHIRWTGPVNQVTRMRRLVVPHLTSMDREKGEPEEKYAEAVKQLNAQQRQSYAFSLSRTLVVDRRQDSMRAPALTRLPARRLGRPKVRSVPDNKVRNRLEAQRKALCSARGNKSGRIGELQLDCQ